MSSEIDDTLVQNSILNTEKKMLGIDLDDDAFDDELLVHINGIVMTLHQLGVGIDQHFYVADNTTTWDELLDNRDDLQAVKTYIYLKLRQQFDPPTNSFVLTSIEKQIAELEWRLNVQAEADHSVSPLEARHESNL